MIVQGVEITDDQVDRILASLRHKHSFTTAEIQSACVFVGISRVDYLAERVADRVLAKLKKSDDIVMTRRSLWEWVRP